MNGRVNVVGVQTRSDAARGRAVLAQAGVTFPSIVGSSLLSDLGEYRIPYTVVVRPDGTMAFGVFGAHDRDFFRERVRHLSGVLDSAANR